VHLNGNGRAQAERMADRLASLSITKIFSSPMERAVETAEPLAARLGAKVEIHEAFNELNFGGWTGRTFSELETIEQWKQWNSYRLGIRPPNGEMMLEVQTRFVAAIERLREHLAKERIAIFSHGDPLKSVLMYYLGMPVDHFLRLDISVASFSILCLADWGARVEGFNLQA